MARDGKGSRSKNSKGGKSYYSKKGDSRNKKSKDRQREDREDLGAADKKGGYAMSSLNDLSWYTRNPLLSEASARLPYPYKPGMSMNFGLDNGTDVNSKFIIPAVMVMDWVPSIGQALKSTDPANLVAREIYAKIRKAYSGTLEADPNDLLIYLMALDSVFIYLGWWKRVYRLVSMYSSQNMAMPNTFLAALGFTDDNIEELRAGKTKLWQYINELVYMSRQLTTPAVMDIFNRHYWMSDNVYTDAASLKAQMYMFNAVSIFMFSKDSEGKGQLTLTPVLGGTGSSTGDGIVESMFMEGQALIQALTNEEDSYIINGYLQRAYEGAPLFQVQELQQDEYIIPVFVPEVLTQIENSSTLPFKGYTSRGSAIPLVNTITQNPANGDVISDPHLTKNSLFDGIVPEFIMLSSRMDMPDVAGNIIMSRLKCYVKSLMRSDNTYAIACGTEIPIAWWLCLENQSSSATQKHLMVHVPPFVHYSPTSTSADSIAEAREWYGAFVVSNFDWHPISFLHIDGSATAGSVISNFGRLAPIGDIHNPTMITYQTLENIHRVCVYSEFNAFAQG